jgi:hypothetical protein|tara:strand:+ start:950 stop:1543 length:594 start_codon:yes stop_codon:yes gene_type:complete
MTPVLSLRNVPISNIATAKRQTTEAWLQQKIDDRKIHFRYFITLSFTKQQTSIINQELDNRHIKRVILDFFYPNKKPKNRVRVWFFVERHLTGGLHLHILLEGMDGLDWLGRNNRKITLSKKTLYQLLEEDISFDDVITEALTNHLQTYVKKLGRGKQSVDMRKIGNIHKRIQYVNKSLSSIDFSNWEHIDFNNSDL